MRGADAIPEKVRLRMDRLRALAERPGTEGEGKAARRQLRRLERRWKRLLDQERESAARDRSVRQEDVEDGFVPSAYVPREDHVCVPCWINHGEVVRLVSSPIERGGRVLRVWFVEGRGLQYKLTVARLSALSDRGERDLELGGRVLPGERVVVSVRSSLHAVSRMSVHVLLDLDRGGERPVLELGA